ncbi:MAG: MBL fold metallo-hydrolase [Eubacteriales bacterium]|nr:MBL fold metallo-hydrolase [Eubacteriales bacterium]
MKITYIGHSGFLVELERTLLLFDYYQGEIPKLPEEKRLYVFASHRHSDHFNPEIFRLAEGREQITFLLSRDIWMCRVPEPLREHVVQMKAGVRWTEPVGQENAATKEASLRVQTLKSTDEGVAFLVKAEGKTIYHGGDLNNWQWAGEAESWNTQMQANFIRNIEPLRNLEIDAAFVPLDPRQENDYTLGMDYFLELTHTKKVYPMHCWEDYSVIDRWFAEHPDSPYREQVVKIGGRGAVFLQDGTHE